ncbi:hypothetical protein Dimus_007609, partial [Dionaea muscipula]
ERAAATYYRGQNNGKVFKLHHYWEIIRVCAKFTESGGSKPRIIPEMATIQPRRSISSEPGENTAIFMTEVEGEENLNTAQVNERTDFFTLSGSNLGLCVQPELVGVESPTPTLVTRPPGRKASKEKLHAKRQKS